MAQNILYIKGVLSRIQVVSLGLWWRRYAKIQPFMLTQYWSDEHSNRSERSLCAIERFISIAFDRVVLIFLHFGGGF